MNLKIAMAFVLRCARIRECQHSHSVSVGKPPLNLASQVEARPPGFGVRPIAVANDENLQRSSDFKWMRAERCDVFKSSMASEQDDSISPESSELSRADAGEDADKTGWPSGISVGRPLGADDVGRRARLLGSLRVVVTYFALALAIVFPLLCKGYLFAFDMSFGPVMRIPIEAYALGGDFGRRLPVFIVLSGISVAVSPAWISRALLIAIPLLGGIGMHRLAPARSEIARYFAGFLYAVNPFVYERLVAGHWHILLGYALLPWAVPSFLNWARSARPKSLLAVGLWLGVIGAVSFAVASLAFVMTFAAALVTRDGARRGRLKSLAALVLIFGATNATWLAAALVRIGDIEKFTTLDFRAFLVRGDSPWEASLNVVRLTGFFRGDFRSPALGTLAGWILLLVVLGLVLLGCVAALRTRRLGPRTASFFMATGLVASVIALGERAPVIGSLLGWLYPRIPGMQIFRESQKLVGLVVLVYALFASLGVEVVLAREVAPDSGDQSRPERSAVVGRVAMAAVLLAVPFAWTPSLFGAAGGKVIVAEYPPGWYEAETALSGLSDSRTLILPWHVHMPISFTGGRTNLNPAGDFFTNELVQASAVEFPGFTLPENDPVDRYIKAAIDGGPGRSDFGAVLAPLGAGSILVIKEADWEKLGFLERQSDLEKVIENDSAIVYKITSDAHGRLTRLAPPGELTTVVPPNPSSVAYLEGESPGAGECVESSGQVVMDSAYSYRVPSAGCWLIPETRSDAWSPPHLLGSADSRVATAARTGGPQRIFYPPAMVALAGHATSGISMLLIAAVLAESRLRRRQSKRSGSSPRTSEGAEAE